MAATCFFQSELTNLQNQFNEVYGDRTVFNINARTQALFAIIRLGLLERQINAASNKDQVRDKIKEFVSGRDVLRKFFASAEKAFAHQDSLKPIQVQSEPIRKTATG